MRPSQLLLWGVYAMALAAFAVAIFILLTFEPLRHDPLAPGLNLPPSLVALGFVIYGAIALLGARYFQKFIIMDDM